jgi:putative polyketide hydroxylase
VLFRAPLEEYLASGVSQFSIDQPDFKAFLTTYGDGRWVLMLSDDEERDEATLRQLIYRAIGRSDLNVELITTGRWELSALIAERFQAGRMFLAGDAAHTLPPSRGGFGANTGIEDVHNLAWKLASVLSGVSTPELLATYDEERRPIAWLRHDQIFAREDYRAEAAGVARGVTIIDDAAMELGQLYRSSAVTGAGPELPPALRPEQWAGQPGTRAPHLWLPSEPHKSTLDLFQRGWQLIAGDQRWTEAAAQAGSSLGIELGCTAIGDQTAFGLGSTGASLVRPDGYVAWRSLELPADPALELGRALRQVAFVAPCL